MAEDINDALWGETNRGPDEGQLKSIVEDVLAIRDLESQVSMAEVMIQELNEKIRQIKQEVIPDKLARAGVSEVKTPNGLIISVDTIVSGSLPKDEENTGVRAAALAYIVEHGGEGIITADVVAKFGRSNRAAALEVANALRGRDDAVVDVKEDVNHMTLKAWARERLRNGEEVDGERVGLWIGRTAVIKDPSAGPKKGKKR